MSGHRASYKQYGLGKYCFVTSFQLIELGDAYITLEQLVEYEDKAQLEAVELRFIREKLCVNKAQPGRTPAQYYTDHVEEIREQVAVYQAANAAKLHEKHNCDCGSCFTLPNKAQHLRTAKHQKWLAE